MWKVKEDLINILIEQARNNEPITYSDLAQRLDAGMIARSNEFANLLCDISNDEDFAGRGLLSVFVINKNTGLPGDRFFQEAEKRGRDTADKKTCWEKERLFVHEIWSKKAIGAQSQPDQEPTPQPPRV
ncbi:MAG: hypothetical protein HGA80_01460 [Candidatus Omnitrophica bacterium]|nr:hypothetical protein [Candidatus Omnitrophota bacterium]